MGQIDLVFLANENARRRYVGRYEVERTSTDEKNIATHRGQRTDVTCVIWMTRVE